MKIRNRILLNYILIFIITTIIAVGSFFLLGLLSQFIENGLLKNQFPAHSLITSNIEDIEYEDVVENHGGIQVIDKNYNIIYSKGTSVFTKNELTAAEFTRFLTNSQSINRKFSYDIAYNESEEFWLVVTFPVSLRFDFNVSYNDYYTSNDSKSVIVVIVVASIFYLFMLLISTFIYSRMTASSFTRPLAKLQEGANKVKSGDYSSRIDLKTKSEFGDLEQAFNQMATQVQQEIELRKKSEDLRRQLTLDIAHDLKNPLAVVMGYAEYCKENPELAQKHLNAIYQNSARANKLITSLFELSKLESSEYKLRKEKTDISEYMRIKIAALLDRIQEANFKYEMDITEKELLANIDVAEMDRVINNLVDNALQYNVEGTTIWVKIRENGCYAEIIIQDDGKGIDSGQAKDIFKPFKRADASRNSETGGSGLGLAIVEKIVKMHGGDIELISDTDKGCKFIINIPII